MSLDYSYTKYFLENYKTIDKNDIKESKIYWGFISCQWRYKFSEDFIEKYSNRLNFHELSKRGNLSDYIIEKFEDRWHYPYLFNYIKRYDTDFLFNKIISFMENGNNYIGNVYLSRMITTFSKYFPLNRIEECKEYINWEFTSRRKDLTKKFVYAYIHKLNLKSLLRFSNIEKICNNEEIDKLKMLIELLR